MQFHCVSIESAVSIERLFQKTMFFASRGRPNRGGLFHFHADNAGQVPDIVSDKLFRRIHAEFVQSVYFCWATQFWSRVLAKIRISMYNKHELWEGKTT